MRVPAVVVESLIVTRCILCAANFAAGLGLVCACVCMYVCVCVRTESRFSRKIQRYTRDEEYKERMTDRSVIDLMNVGREIIYVTRTERLTR